MWLAQKEELTGCAKRQGQDFHRRRVACKPSEDPSTSKNSARRPELEAILKSWILEERAKSRPVQLEEIRRKARELSDDDTFTASKGWLYRFLKRHSLSCRRATHIGQSLPACAGLVAKLFFDEVEQAIRSGNVSRKQIINMDETPCYFDLPDARTVSSKGEKSIPIATSGYEKMRFTTVLATNADGGKLSPMLIFKNLKNVPKLKKGEKWPDSIHVTVSPGGTMTAELLEEWAKNVYEKRSGALFQQPNLLIMDSATCHNKDVITRISKRCQVVFVPKGCTSILQPLDVAVNKPFKQYLQEQWKEWMFMLESERKYTTGGKRQRASYVEVAHWVANAWQRVTSATIINSFTCTGITGSKDQLHGKLRRIVDDSTMDVMDSSDSDSEEELVIEDEDTGLIEAEENTALAIVIAPKSKSGGDNKTRSKTDGKTDKQKVKIEAVTSPTDKVITLSDDDELTESETDDNKKTDNMKDKIIDEITKELTQELTDQVTQELADKMVEELIEELTNKMTETTSMVKREPL